MSQVSLRGGKEPPPSYGATQSTNFITDVSSSKSESGSSSDISTRIADKVGDHLTISVEEGKPKHADHVQGDPFLSFHDITYEVHGGRLGIGDRKIVLKSVSGYMQKGLNAVMGPTGSGKTSLLDILAGRKGKAGIGGVVLVNGDRQPKNFKCMSGYVVQDDTILGTLTVRENLHFSAALRLPSKTTWKQRKERVQKVIDELHLNSCANTKIGTDFFRGVSGGERKRTNIGMELIIEPEVLFLDEPTTGLDANTAVAVVCVLKELIERKNQVVIMSIHQPRYSIFKLFDSLTLLTKGNEVYHGPANHALPYFDNLGFHCEEHENPADFFLDVLTQCEYEDRRAAGESDADSLAPLVQPLDLRNCYEQSELYRQAAEKLNPLLDSLHERDRQNGRKQLGRAATYATSFLWQFLVIGVRSLLHLTRSPQAALSQISVMMIYALIIGALYFQLQDRNLTLQTVINDRFGAFFFIIMNQVFSNMSAIDVFIREKAFFVYENSNGYYRVSAFFLAKVITNMIPTRLLPLIPSCVFVYFMVGFQLSVSKFFIFYLTLNLISAASTAIAFAISSRFTVTAVATLFTGLAYVLQMLFGGFLISLESMPVYLFWVKYLSIFRYALQAFTINEIAGQSYNVTCNNNTMALDSFSITEQSICTVNGTEALLERGFETSTEWLWYDEIILAAITIVCLIITYINLRMVKKYK